jgi:hypothetical protein
MHLSFIIAKRLTAAGIEFSPAARTLIKAVDMHRKEPRTTKPLDIDMHLSFIIAKRRPHLNALLVSHAHIRSAHSVYGSGGDGGGGGRLCILLRGGGSPATPKQRADALFLP